MNMKYLWLWFMLCLGSGLAQAVSGVYVGKVGTLPVVLQLQSGITSWQLGDFENHTGWDEWEGVYYYLNKKQDLWLKRTEKDKLEFDEFANQEKKFSGHFSLIYKNNQLSGVWKNYTTQKTLEVHLRRVTHADIQIKRSLPKDLADWAIQNPYFFLKIDQNFVPLTAKAVHEGLYSYRWYIEPYTQTRMIQFTSGYPAKQQEKINNALYYYHFHQIESALDCMGMSQAAAYESNPYISLLHPEILSIVSQVYYSCAGTAHPDGGIEPLILNTQTAQPLKLEDLYLFVGKVPKLLDLSHGEPFDLYNEYSKKRSAVITHITYPMIQNDPNFNTEECSYDDTSNWQYIDNSWYISPKGLVIVPSYPHAMQMCSMDVTIPYQTTRKYKNPQSILSF